MLLYVFIKVSSLIYKYIYIDSCYDVMGESRNVEVCPRGCFCCYAFEKKSQNG